jgi:exodeoxyribonuclease V gamma subunit
VPLFIHHTNHIEELIDPFVEVVSQPLEGKLEKEKILVQSVGMGRYFITKAAEKTGVFANFEFLFPQKFLTELCKFYGVDSTADSKYHTTWKIYSRLKENSVSLGSELDEYIMSASELKLFSFASTVADIFDQYSMYRPEMIRYWDTNRALLANGDSLPEEFLWQFKLWKELYPGGKNHRASLIHSLFEKVKNANHAPYTHLTAVGISNLPKFYINLLIQLSEILDIHLFLLNPSPHYWYDIVKEKKFINSMITDFLRGSTLKNEDYYFLGNRLLSLYASQGQDFFLNLLSSESDSVDNEKFEEITPVSLLQHIQNDIYSLISRDEFTDSPQEKFTVADSDRSITLHGCHNKMRQLEVLHDLLLDCFNNDESLVPGDILVMAPSISEFEPYIRAVFDSESDAYQQLPYTIADLSSADTNPLAEIMLTLLTFENRPVTHSLLSGLINSDIICRSFHITLAEKEEALALLDESAFRWGIDGDERLNEVGIEYTELSLSHAIKRIALSIVFSSQEDLFESNNRASDLESGEIELAGKVLDLLTTIERYVAIFQTERTVSEWNEVLRNLVQDFFKNDSSSADFVSELHSAISEVCDVPDSSIPVPFSILNYELTKILTQEKKQFGFLDGKITFCEMLPMRSIPFKIIVIVGMDEGLFPRYTKPLTIDLIQNFPQSGDRTRQNDDRYLFLETLLSAREKLIITYTAFNMSDNSEKKPSQLVSELFNYISENCDTESLISQITFMHRSHPFAEEYFSEQSGLFTYRNEYAELLTDTSSNLTPFSPCGEINVEVPLELKELSVSTLVNFFNNPLRYFLKHRVNVKLAPDTLEYEDEEPLALYMFDDAAIVETLAEKLINGDDISTYKDVLLNSGSLPLKAIGEYEYSVLKSNALFLSSEFNKTIPDSTTPFYYTYSTSLLSGSMSISGSLPHSSNGEYYMVQYSWNDYSRLKFYILHLFLHAAGFTYTGKIITGDGIKKLPPLDIKDASYCADEILKLYYSGLFKPLAFFKSISLKTYLFTRKKAESTLADIIQFALKESRRSNPSYQQYRDIFSEFCCLDKSELIDEQFVKNSTTFFRLYNEVFPDE